MHMTLIDPASQPSHDGVKIAEEAIRLGTNAIMVGGSTGVTQDGLDDLVSGIKAHSDIPVIHFPSSAGAISTKVDAIYFMSTLNSRNPEYITGEQARGAPLLRAVGIEPIGLGYIIIEPGMTVGRVSDADLIPRSPDGAKRAVGYALAAEYFGMGLVYLEAGSGAEQPVPISHVEAVADVLSIPLMVGGGIREARAARAALDAGADVLVTGTVAEKRGFDRLEAIIDEVGRGR